MLIPTDTYVEPVALTALVWSSCSSGSEESWPVYDLWMRQCHEMILEIVDDLPLGCGELKRCDQGTLWAHPTMIWFSSFSYIQHLSFLSRWRANQYWFHHGSNVSTVLTFLPRVLVFSIQNYRYTSVSLVTKILLLLHLQIICQNGSTGSPSMYIFATKSPHYELIQSLGTHIFVFSSSLLNKLYFLPWPIIADSKTCRCAGSGSGLHSSFFYSS